MFNAVKADVSEEEKLKNIGIILGKKRKPDINYQNTNRDTALHFAVRQGECKVVELLIKEGAGINDDDLKNKRGRTPLDVAKNSAKQNGPEIVSILEGHLKPVSGSSDQNGERKRTRDGSDEIDGKKPRTSYPIAQPSQRNDLMGQSGPSGRNKRPDDGGIDSVPRKMPKTFGVDNLKEYSASGLKKTLHGNIYQLKLLMLFLKRGLDRGYSFLLATEMDDAEKFDDLVFQYDNEREDGIVYRFLQAKHKQDESKMITARELLTEQDDEFSLQKYFISYRKIQQNQEFKRQNCEFKDFVICTNIGLSEELQNSFDRMMDNDDILDVNVLGDKQPKRLKFRGSDTFGKESLISVFQETSDLRRLARKLAEYIFVSGNSDKTIGLSDDLFKKYHGALADKVIDVKNRKFKNDFVDGSNLSEEVRKFRKALLERSKLDEDDFRKDLQSKNLRISYNFGRVVRVVKLPNIDMSSSQKLAEKIVNLISGRDPNEIVSIELKAPTVRNNIGELVGHVFIRTDDKIKIREGFLDNVPLPGNLNEFRECLKTELSSKNLQFSQLGQYQFKIEINICTGDDYREYEMDGSYFDDLYKLPNDDVRTEEIDAFLDKLVFAVNQPNEDELGDIIRNELGREYNNIDTEIVYSRFLRRMLDWMKEKKGRFFSHEDGRKFFGTVKEDILGTVWFDVKDPVAVFTGREQELMDLHDKIQRESGEKTVISQMTSISGLGGIGKTELARKYAYNFGHYYDDNIVWIDAETRLTITASFMDLARDSKLGIPTKTSNGENKDIKFIVKEIYNFFATRKSLFIFDNAESSSDLTDFLPLRDLSRKDKKPYILITSRIRKWKGKVEVLSLKELKVDDAIKFVKKGLYIEDGTQDQEVKILVDKLQRFPLAIQQAISYINDQKEIRKFTIENYLDEYEEKTKDLLNSKLFNGFDNDYTKTTFTTWKITIDRIKEEADGPLALRILDIIAYFAPESIKRIIFLNLVENDTTKLGEVIRILIDYSMVNGEKPGKQSILSIHRLVQEVTRLQLREDGKEEDVLREALKLINSGNIPEKSILSAMFVWSYASKYTNLIDDYFFSSHSVYGYSRATPLHLFAEKNINGALESVLEYTKEKYSKEMFNTAINTKDTYSRTPLYVAAENGYLSIVELLVEAGADLNIKSTIAYGTLSTKRSSGWTPLHIAAYNGHADVVRFLAAKDQKLLDIKDTLDRTPLLLAINAGQKDVVMSIEHDVASLLHTAVQDKDLETIRNLLSDNVGIVNSKLGDWTPLHLAAFNGDLSIVEFLIQKMEEQNISKEDGIDHPSNDGFTPLHAASSNGHLDVVMFLISQGANVQAVNDEGWTILHAAAQNGRLPVVKYLINSIVFNVNIHDQKNDTPLHTAAFHGQKDVVEYLKQKKANINAVNVIGGTPLFSAALTNNQDIVYFLLKSGATVTTDDETLIGKTKFSLLHLAAMYDNVEMIKYLIDIKGIDKDIGKDDSVTPLHVAAFFGNVKSIDCLIEKGANVDAIVQVSKGKAVFDSVEDMASNIPSVGQYLNIFIKLGNLATKVINERYFYKLVTNALNLLSITPNLIYKTLDYPERKVLNEKRRGFLRRRLDDITVTSVSYILNIDYVKKQFTNVKTFVNNRKNQESAFLIEEEVAQEHSVPLGECLPGPSHRRKRNTEEKCLFTWDDVDEFNEEKSEIRNLRKIKINSDKFIDYIETTSMTDGKLYQLIQLADQAKILGQSQSQSLVSKLINNQKVINHLGKVGRVSGMVMHGMMGKNVLVDFLNDNYQGVAVNIGFIACGQGFARLAQVSSLKGLRLSSEGKVIGRFLRAASPFLARGTSAFVVYDLVNQIKAFNNGTEEAVIGIVGDSIYLGVDAAEIGIEIAETFALLEGVSSITGPIGAAIGAVVFVSTDIFMAVERVDKIDKIIHLTGNERFIEGLRAFVGVQPEKYLKELLEEKDLANELVKQGFQYLQQHRDIQNYIFPTGKSIIDSCRNVPYKTTVCSGGFHWCSATRTVTRYTKKCTTKFKVNLDSTVLLDAKRTGIKWSRAKPDDLPDGRLFCLPKGDYQPAPSYGSYVCENAIGLTDLTATGNHNLINLGEGTDYAKGFIDSPNIFIVNNGSKTYFGGNRDDLFIFQGSSIRGYFYGNAGVNTLDLTSFAPEKHSIDIELHIGKVRDYYEHNSIAVTEINRLLGRKDMADRAFISCDSDASDVKFVDGQGGSNKFMDYIKIYDKDCAYNMEIVVRPNTDIYNYALAGDFHYTIPYGYGSAKINFLYSQEELNLNNTFTFEYEPTEIKIIDARNINILNKALHTIHFSFSPMTNREFNLTISGARNPIYRLGRNTEIKVGNRGNLYMLQNTKKSVKNIINIYTIMANRIPKMSFFIQSQLNNETVIIGSGNHEVIHNNPLCKSHLVGNGGENVYVLNSEIAFPLPEVIIYDLDAQSSIDTIDLRKLIQNTHDVKLQILKSSNDLILKATVTEEKPREKPREKPYLSISKIPLDYFTVRLKDGINWYNKTQVIVHNVPMKINLDSNIWSLKPQPLVFEKDKEIIIVTNEDIEENTELKIPKKAGNYSLARANTNDLIVTNAFDPNITNKDLCTLVFSKFYETSKMKTLSIKFSDKKIILKDHQEQINNARDLNIAKKVFENQVYHFKSINHTKRTKLSPRIVTSSATKLSSWINDLFDWVKNVKTSMVGLLLSSRDALPTEIRAEAQNTVTKSQINTQIDINGTIMLLNVLVRKVSGQKYIATVDQPMSSLEAQGYALNITSEFIKELTKIATKSGISLTNLNLDPVEVQSAILGQILSENFSEIPKILYSFAKEACP